MKNWNYWVPRALAGIVALVVLGLALPWASFENYIFSPVSVLRIVAVPWLIGVHCLVLKRVQWLGWVLLAGAAAVFVLAIVARVFSGPPISYGQPALYALSNNVQWACSAIAIGALLLTFRLRGVRQAVQYMTAIVLVLELAAYWGCFGVPRGLVHAMWIIRGCLGLLAYVGLFVTTYNIALYHEPFEPHIPVGDAADRLKVECPCCMKMQELPLGGSGCKDCGVRIYIEIEEKSCAKCGYSLRGLPARICPECGTPFGAQPVRV